MDTCSSLRSAVFIALSGAAIGLPFSQPVQAGFPAFYAGFQPAFQERQLGWRQVAPVSRMGGPSRWRPVASSERGMNPGWRGLRGQYPPQSQRWSRNARPISRARDPVSQFRPDHRYEQPGETSEASSTVENPDLHAQFRPVTPRSRLTYEQLYPAQPVHPARPRPVPVTPYPVIPYMQAPPRMPPTPYWPAW